MKNVEETRDQVPLSLSLCEWQVKR